MKAVFIPILCVALLAPAFAREAPNVTPDSVKKIIDQNGPVGTVRKLIVGDRPRPWENVLRGIESGNQQWLDVARALADGTDAGTSEDLQVALATALPNNPAGVLKLAGVQSFLSIDNLCGAPFIEPEPKVLKRYLRKAKTALETLKDKSVEQQRVRCLADIQAAIAQVNRGTSAVKLKR
jgi:hypothetical protein